MLSSNASNVLQNSKLACFISSSDKMLIILEDSANPGNTVKPLRPPIFAVCEKGHVSRYALDSNSKPVDSNELKESKKALVTINSFYAKMNTTDRSHLHNVLTAYNSQNIISSAISTRYLIERMIQIVYYDKHIKSILGPMDDIMKKGNIGKFLHILAQTYIPSPDQPELNLANTKIQGLVSSSEFNLCDPDILKILKRLPKYNGHYSYLSRIVHGSDPGNTQKVFNTYKDVITLLSLVRW